MSSFNVCIDGGVCLHDDLIDELRAANASLQATVERLAHHVGVQRRLLIQCRSMLIHGLEFERHNGLKQDIDAALRGSMKEEVLGE